MEGLHPLATEHIRRTDPVEKGDQWRSATTDNIYIITQIERDKVTLAPILGGNSVSCTEYALRYGFYRFPARG